MTNLKFFYVTATTKYDGFEWAHNMVGCADSLEIGQQKADEFNFTHDNGIETQQVDTIREITETEYHVFAKYLPELHCF